MESKQIETNKYYMVESYSIMKKSYFLLFMISMLFSFSCSLNYLNGENSEDSTPEFCFKNASYQKFEDNKKKVSLKAEQMEQYKIDGAVFAKNASFETFDSEGKPETEGQCDLVSANTQRKIYTLYGNISLTLPKQEMTICADSLNFNKKTEQITSGKTGEVRLTKKDISMSGYGFSASGVSKSFSFIDTVSGVIKTNDEKGGQKDENN